MKAVLNTLLIILLIVQCLSGLWGGSFLILKPDGSLFNMPVEALKQGPFTDFLIPGLALFLLLGVVPGLAAYGLLTRPQWKWAQRLNVYSDQHWAWTFSLYTGLMLIIWMDVQVAVIGFGDILQSIYMVMGLALTILTLLPAIKNSHKR